jgi:Predicted transcriptional regulator with C-terminal CBS domains
MVGYCCRMSTLADIRKELGLTQEGLARQADLPLPTYRNAEKDKNVSYTTAKAIFIAVNKIKEKKGEKQLEKIEDLGLSIV